MSQMVLHNFFRSSTSTRLRVALNLKGMTYHYVSYALRKGETRTAQYLAMNPQGLVPTLGLEDGTVLTQSLAIIEWLEEIRPEPPLLPVDAVDRARVRAIAYAISCEVHPLNNLRVLERLRAQFSADDEAVADWFRHWVAITLEPLEVMIASDRRTGAFCHGDTPTLADVCLYAQVWNNKRFAIDMAPYPTVTRIFDACEAVEAFRSARPSAQPDAPAEFNQLI